MVDTGQLAGERLADVFLTQRPVLRAFLRARCLQQDVDDLLQELWLEVQHAPALVVPDPLSHLYRAAHRIVVERGRGASRADRRAGRRLPEVERALIVPRPAPDVLRGLGERTERVFRQYRLTGGSCRQIADGLGLSPGIVQMELNRAYAALVLSRAVTA